MALGLRTVVYRVPDITEAKKWYTAAFNVSPYFDEPFYVGFSIGGYELGLQPLEKTASVAPSSSLTYWGVEDIRVDRAHLLKCGATPGDPIENVGGPLEVCSVFDPWGNEIGLIYNPEFKLPS